MCGPSRNRKQEHAINEQNRLLEEQRQQEQARLAEQQRLEAERTDKINANVASITDAFSGFDDSYFEQAGQNLVDFKVPQLNEKFTDAQEQIAFDLANRGLSDSSTAADKASDLKTLFDQELTNIQNEATTLSNQLRSDVASRQSNLRGLAESGASLDSFDTLVAPEVSSIQVPTNFSPLGDIFGSLVNDFNVLQQSGAIPTFIGDNQGGGTTGSAARVIK